MGQLKCPSCRETMQRQRFARKLGGDVELDVCFGCRGIWFDDYESLQLAPDGVVALFETIHRHRADPLRQLAGRLSCPRCRHTLDTARDLVKSGWFTYFRCSDKHGRFTTFGQFMIEKGFVRQLNGQEIKRLAATVGTVYCASCGAPVDIRRDSACTHCRAPVALLDADAVEKALAGYRRPSAPAPAAAMPPTVDFTPARPAAMDMEVADLLRMGVDAVWRRLSG